MLVFRQSVGIGGGGPENETDYGILRLKVTLHQGGPQVLRTVRFGHDPIPKRRGEALRFKKQSSRNFSIGLDRQNLAIGNRVLQLIWCRQLIGEWIEAGLDHFHDLGAVTFIRRRELKVFRQSSCRRRRAGLRGAGEPKQPRMRFKTRLLQDVNVWLDGRFGAGLPRINDLRVTWMYIVANLTKLTALFGLFAAATSVDAVPSVFGENARAHALPSHGRSSNSASHQ